MLTVTGYLLSFISYSMMFNQLSLIGVMNATNFCANMK